MAHPPSVPPATGFVRPLRRVALIGGAVLLATYIALAVVVPMLPRSIACRIRMCEPDQSLRYSSAMRSDLRNLVVAQDAFASDNGGAYASSIDVLTGRYFVASPGVIVKIDSVKQEGWSAIASHDRTTKTCRITFKRLESASPTPAC